MADVTEVVFSNESRTVPAHTVFFADDWTSEWVEKEHLHCDFIQFTANPDMAKAQFTWYYGRVLRPGETEWEQVERLDILRTFVKVEFTPVDAEEGADPTIWYGILEEDHGEQKGLLTASPDEDASGRQVLTAYGLDVMLQRHVLRESLAFDANGAEITVFRALEFNHQSQIDGADKTETGNRSEDEGSDGCYLFAHDLTNAKFWTTYEAVRYLLKTQPPKDDIDNLVVEWALDAGAALGDIPDFDKPRKPCQGRTMRQVLDELIDRRRLIGYTVEVDVGGGSGGEDRIIVRTFTFTPEDIDFEDNIIPANLSQKSLVFDADAAVQTAFVKKATLEAIDQVVCTGDRAVACFSLMAHVRSDINTLVPQWSDDQKDQYDSGASESDGYDSLDPFQQEERNKAARHRQHVKRVYSYFGLPKDWDGRVTTASGDYHLYFPHPTDEDHPLPFYQSQLRFKHHLPLKTDHDYSEDKISDDEVEDNTPEGQKWEYLPPLIAIKVPADADADPSDDFRFQYVDRMATNTEAEGVEELTLEDGRTWSASVRMQDDAPGIAITVHGLPQHVLAADQDQDDCFVPLVADENELEELGGFHWHNVLIATVAMDVDKFCEGRYPENPAESQVVRRLIIDLGDEYQQHYVSAGTMVDIDNEGHIVTADTAGYIRDDSKKLESLARLVFEWYRTERQSIELTFGYLTGKLSIGDLITTIGEGDSLQTINSVVTSIRYEWTLQDTTQPGSSRTTITTQFAEIDAQHFVQQGHRHAAAGK